MWASEQLVGIAQPTSESVPRKLRHSAETDAMLFAKTLFDMKEYLRAAELLEGAADPAARFLRCYAVYLGGEKQKEERITEMGDKMMTVVQNEALPALAIELEASCAAHPTDGFLLFLWGLVTKEQGDASQALALLQQSVSLFSCNWSAWLQLVAVCAENPDLALQLTLPEHWIVKFMQSRLAQQVHRNSDALQGFNQLRPLFPRSTDVLAHRAICHYQMRDFDEAEVQGCRPCRALTVPSVQVLFEELLKKDPHRLHGMVTPTALVYMVVTPTALVYMVVTPTALV